MAKKEVIEEVVEETVEVSDLFPGATEVEIQAVETVPEPAVIEIIPGKKVRVEEPGMEDIDFIISQQLADGRVSVLGPNGVILYVYPGEIRDIK